MADPLNATITVNIDGEEQEWRFTLSPDAHLSSKELIPELVKEFDPEGREGAKYELKYDGTFGEPVFTLTRDCSVVGKKTRI